MATSSIHDVLISLERHPTLCAGVPFAVLDRFLRFARRLIPEIRLALPEPRSKVPPYRLPVYIHDFFKHSLELDDATAIELWDSLKDTVWKAGSMDLSSLSNEELGIFQEHGYQADDVTECLGMCY